MKNKMIATTIEQSKHLLELGLDPKTADMCFEMEKGNWTLNVGRKSAQVNRGFAIPAWSLDALLEVMPKGVELIKMQNDANELYYEIDYMYTGYEDKDPVTAAYKMVCWLLEQGLIKKGDNDDSKD